MEQFLDNIKDLEVTTVVRVRKKLLIKKKLQPSLSVAKLPYCAVNLQIHCQVLAENKAHIYSSSIVKNQANSDLQEFRSRYGEYQLYQVLFITDGQINVRCDSSKSAQEISDFAEDCKIRANKS